MLIIKEDKINDLVILKISDEDFKYFDEIPYNFSSRVLDIGEEVFIRISINKFYG